MDRIAITPTGTHAVVRPADAVPAPLRQYERAFPALTPQVAEARRFLARILSGCTVADDAILCLSELAANACLHSASQLPGGTFTVRVLILDGAEVRIEVADNGGPWTARDGDDRPHGLTIVASLASDSGVAGDTVTGRTSWATFSCHPRAGAEPGRAGCYLSG
jgi:Histidine kinase-like ATPase domain